MGTCDIMYCIVLNMTSQCDVMYWLQWRYMYMLMNIIKTTLVQGYSLNNLKQYWYESKNCLPLIITAALSSDHISNLCFIYVEYVKLLLSFTVHSIKTWEQSTYISTSRYERIWIYITVYIMLIFLWERSQEREDQGVSWLMRTNFPSPF